jgi:plastocyanin
MRRLALLPVLALLAFPLTAGSMEMNAGSGPQISILFGSVTPVTTDAVVGDEVTWTNDSVRNHTVTADDGSYDSGTLGPNGQFMRAFASAGTYTYYCRLHPYIRGEVNVHTLLLDRPSQPGAPGHAYPLSGRAALPAGHDVAIEFNGGSGWEKAADATVAGDGTFTARVVPPASGRYRAVAAGDESPAVGLLVLDRTVNAGTRRTRTGSRIGVTVTPASPGATVVLQLYLKDRFGWWPVSRKRLNRDSRAVFTVRPRRRVSARVVLTLPDGATVIAMTPVLRLHH